MTININKNETKKVFFTLTPTLSDPYYIFRFVSNDTSNVTLMGQEDISTDPSFQTFTFSEGSTYSTVGGFTLNPGTYDYSVYETQYRDLNTASASGILKTGLMNVFGNEYAFFDYDEDYVYYDESVGLNVIGITGPAGATGATGPAGPIGSILVLDMYNSVDDVISESDDLSFDNVRINDESLYITNAKSIKIKQIGKYLVMLSFSVSGTEKQYKVTTYKNEVVVPGGVKYNYISGEENYSTTALQFIFNVDSVNSILRFNLQVLSSGDVTVLNNTLDLSILKI